MNRRTKIIVSVSGIFIVALALIGLTYAYFLTRINGNINAKSISVSTAKLELTYSDNSSEILGSGKVLQPSSEPIGTKTFTVTNNGEDTNYSVVLENMSITNVSDSTETTFESNDFVYTLTCKDKSNNACVNEVSEETVFPLSDGAIINNDIAKGDVHNYTLTLWYKETGIDQSADMGKALNAKINIIDPTKENPYRLQKDSLAYHIINNSINRTNGTNFVSTPKTIPAKEPSSFEYIKGQDPTTFNYSRTSATSYYISYADDYTVNKTTGLFTLVNPTTVKYSTSVSASDIAGKYAYWSTKETTAKNTTNLSYIYKITTNTSDITSSTITYAEISSSASASNTISTERELSFAPDDYGTSYYFRGNVEDNYVTFADMCWRIIRINGDGTTKLILEDQDQPCSTSINGNWDIPTTTGGTTKTGNFGYTQYAEETLTASDGTTKNSSTRYLMDYLHGQTNSASSMATTFKNFQSTFTENELSKLKSENWCLNDTAYVSSNNLLNSTQIMDNKIKGTKFNYDSLVRLYNNSPKQPTLKCNGTIMNDWDDDANNPTPMYIGTITADEIVYAGGKVYTSNQNYYLINNYQKSNSKYFWSLSPSYFGGLGDGAFSVHVDGSLFDSSVSGIVSRSFRPSVSIATGVEILSGDGTKTNPYKIK